MEEKFAEDLKKLYEKIGQRQVELGRYYEIIEDKNEEDELKRFFDEILVELDLEPSNQNKLALISRLVALREEQMVQAFNAASFDAKEIAHKKRIAYFWTKNFYLKRHEELLEWIEKENLLNPFYQKLLRGVHEVGIALSNWQDEWNEHIINTINPKLKELYGEDVMEYLRANGLLQKDGQRVAERAYSVLAPCHQGFVVQSYAKFFEKDVQEVVAKLELLIHNLKSLEDNDTNQKEAYTNYLKALVKAFGQTQSDKLIKDWQNVDRAWMQVKSPLQIGHPLEYYEDHYRKAVALEWDVRMSNPQNLEAAKTYKNIIFMYKTLFDKLGKEKEDVYTLTLSNLERVQLYIGRPALYYGAEFNGLFSAQVVPNDEQVSKEEGKKIFAFADNILDSLRAKPFLKIQRIIFGEEFLNKERKLVFKEPENWHKVYEITTIGHEYGHILWLDEDTENVMNQSGVFKNIEEFKATMGGLMAFFMNEEESLKNYVLGDIIKRAVGLIAWMQTDEVQPYYCEGLIHLQGLFESGVLFFDEELRIDESKYEDLKQWYFKTYESLVKHYLAKKDAKEFLNQYAKKINGTYLPVDYNVKKFVSYYWDLHKDIGRDIDEQSSKKEWL